MHATSQSSAARTCPLMPCCSMRRLDIKGWARVVDFCSGIVQLPTSLAPAAMRVCNGAGWIWLLAAPFWVRSRRFGWYSEQGCTSVL